MTKIISSGGGSGGSIPDTIEVTQTTASKLNATVTATHLDTRHLNITDDAVNVGTVTTLPAITGSVTVSNMIPAVETGLATSAKQLPDNHKVTVDNINSTPLITGFATSANQLADGHNVTVDNSTGDNAVNIRDGGNTITVDGTVNATCSGSVTVSNMIPAVETGLATSAKQLADGHNVTVDNTGAGSAVNIQDGGNTITVDGSVTVSATDLDVRDIDWSTDDIKVYAADESQRILSEDAAVTTINYSDATKTVVSNIVTAGATRKVTDTYNNAGATTLVITRAVANV